VGLLLVVAAPAPRAHATVQFSLAPVPMDASGGTFSITFLVTPFTFGVPSSTSTTTDIQITGGQYKDASSAVLNDFSLTLPPVAHVFDDLNWDGSALTGTFSFDFNDQGRNFEITSSHTICHLVDFSFPCAADSLDDSSPDTLHLSYVPSPASAPEPPGWVLLAVGVALVGWICQQRARRQVTPPRPAVTERTC